MPPLSTPRRPMSACSVRSARYEPNSYILQPGRGHASLRSLRRERERAASERHMRNVPRTAQSKMLRLAEEMGHMFDSTSHSFGAELPRFGDKNKTYSQRTVETVPLRRSDILKGAQEVPHELWVRSLRNDGVDLTARVHRNINVGCHSDRTHVDAPQGYSGKFLGAHVTHTNNQDDWVLCPVAQGKLAPEKCPNRYPFEGGCRGISVQNGKCLPNMTFS